MKRKKENYKQYIEYWIKNNPDKSLQECEYLHKQYTKSTNYQCIEYYIRKYPDKSLQECEELKNIAIKKAQEKQLYKKQGQNNPCSKTNRDELKRKQGSPYSIEFYKKRYPDKSIAELFEIRQNFINKRKYLPENNPTTIEYYINKGYNQDEAKILRRNRQRTFTLEKCIEKYGESEGKKVFKERQIKWVEKLQKSFLEKGTNNCSSSIKEIELVKELCKRLNIEIPKKQKYITFENKHYAFDFEFNKKVIEYNGDYWHCNPQIYEKSFIHRTKKISAEEIWKEDENKIKAAKALGYEVLVIWESEYLLNKEYVIDKCINFINS